MTLGKAPVIGGIVGGAFAVWRLGSTAVAAARGEQVDWAKQGQLALCEVGSGVLSTFPVAGTAGSVALDVYVLSNDMTDSAKKNDPSVPVQNFRPYSA